MPEDTDAPATGKKPWEFHKLTLNFHSQIESQNLKISQLKNQQGEAQCRDPYKGFVEFHWNISCTGRVEIITHQKVQESNMNTFHFNESQPTLTF